MLALFLYHEWVRYNYLRSAKWFLVIKIFWWGERQLIQSAFWVTHGHHTHGWPWPYSWPFYRWANGRLALKPLLGSPFGLYAPQDNENNDDNDSNAKHWGGDTDYSNVDGRSRWSNIRIWKLYTKINACPKSFNWDLEISRYPIMVKPTF